MVTISQLDTDISALFFEPLQLVYPDTESQYRCKTINDLDYAALGISRCISHTKSGHEFLQHHIDHGREGVSVDLFFKSLKSNRRLTNLISLNAQLVSVMKEKVEDPLSRF